MITFILEIIGTIAFAASGAMVGVERKMDIFGVSVLGIVTAVGGGMIRDLVMGFTPPAVFRNPIYAVIATITSCIVFASLYLHKGAFDQKKKMRFDQLLLVMDTVGLGIFTVVGVNAGLQNGYRGYTFLLVFVGTITGVGGGLLRDMMADVPPYIFVKHVYACASLVGAISCVIIDLFWGDVAAMILGSCVVILIRYFAARYHWNLPRFDKSIEVGNE